MTSMPERGDIVTLKVESSGFEGTSIARHEGMVVFVAGAVAGDVVKARVTVKKKKHLEATVVEVMEPSASRTEPRCSYFGACGGCGWQHVKYEDQLAFKQQHVVDSLERIGKLKGVQVLPIVASKEIYFYRNKLEFSFGDRRWLSEEEMASGADPSVRGGELLLGFHVPERYDRILDIRECHLQSDLSNDILNAVRQFAVDRGLPVYTSIPQSGYLRNLVIREGKNTGDVMVNLVTLDDRPAVMEDLAARLTDLFPEIVTIVNNVNTKKANIAVGDFEKVYYGSGVITEKMGPLLLHISANSFLQTNTRQAEVLYGIVKEFADLRSADEVYDLYCGTGSISLFVANAVHHVTGIELVESSIMNARMNAEANGIANCEFIAGDLKDLLTKDVEWKAGRKKPDVLIIDPPRSGMHPKAVEEVGKMGVPRVLYVSCNPATLARDLQLLVPYGYSVEMVQPVDMFPHTYHIECVTVLRMRG
ncbi:MAG TPA: 23S rRNA (uracil(1939)-C(5))-methyltransferase RlmD [Bacteroidota bacterium]|nr:23S rRNA (uracil(1939)-C(5))-methyltransferase RlmD [Bacteroidota bacterium]